MGRNQLRHWTSRTTSICATELSVLLLCPTCSAHTHPICKSGERGEESLCNDFIKYNPKKSWNSCLALITENCGFRLMVRSLWDTEQYLFFSFSAPIFLQCSYFPAFSWPLIDTDSFFEPKPEAFVFIALHDRERQGAKCTHTFSFYLLSPFVGIIYTYGKLLLVTNTSSSGALHSEKCLGLKGQVYHLAYR